MRPLLRALQAFRQGRKRLLDLEAAAVEEGVPILWLAQPDRRSRYLPLAAAAVAALASTLLFLVSEPGNLAILVLAIAFLTLLPGIIILDWNQTEFLATPVDIRIRLGAFTREPMTIPWDRLEGWRILEGAASRLFDVADIHLLLAAAPTARGAKDSPSTSVRIRGLFDDDALTLAIILESKVAPAPPPREGASDD